MTNYRAISYFNTRPDVVQIFNDLEAYHSWCKFQMCNFDPADLYRKDSKLYTQYTFSTKGRRPHNDDRPRYNKQKPASTTNKFYSRSPRTER